MVARANKKFHPSLFQRLEQNIVSYVDAVDNGRKETVQDVPCFAQIVDALNHGAQTLDDFDKQFEKAALIATMIIDGTVKEEFDPTVENYFTQSNEDRCL